MEKYCVCVDGKYFQDYHYDVDAEDEHQALAKAKENAALDGLEHIGHYTVYKLVTKTVEKTCLEYVCDEKLEGWDAIVAEHSS